MIYAAMIIGVALGVWWRLKHPKYPVQLGGDGVPGGGLRVELGWARVQGRGGGRHVVVVDGDLDITV